MVETHIHADFLSGARASVAAAYLARTGRDVTVVNASFANDRKIAGVVMRRYYGDPAGAAPRALM